MADQDQETIDKTCEIDLKIDESWDDIQAQLRRLYEMTDELTEIRKILMLNFGSVGRHSRLCNLGSGKRESTRDLLVKVLKKFVPE